MDIKRNAADCQRKFGFVDVEWLIENYFIQTCKASRVIYSPEFTVRGSDVTKWRLSLKLNTKGKHVGWTYLERLGTDSFSDEVRVKWKLFYPCGEKLHLITQTASNFGKVSEFGMQIYDLDKLERDMHSIPSNTFIVRCLMMVYSTDSSTFSRSKNMGMRSLSQDMAVVFRLMIHPDLMCCVEGRTLPAHKAVLCSRNKLIESKVADAELILKLKSSVELEASKNLFAYLYTGNLDYVLRTPSLELQDCINFFKVEQLADHYTPDEITLCTNSEDQEYTFKWTIRDFKPEVDKCITSSVLGKQLTNWTFRLHLYTNGIRGKSEHMSIFAEILDGDWPEYLFLQFAVVNIIEGYAHLQSKRVWEPQCGEKIGIENFISRDTLKMSGFVWHDTLTVVCKIHLPVGSQILSILRTKIYCNISCETEPHYELLSNNISGLFEKGTHSDFTIVCGETSFKVHKFILMSRSHRLRNIICQANDEKSISLSCTEPNILRQVLLYLYSGKLKDFQTGDVVKIYVIAERFSILSLKYTCSDILQENIEAHNFVELMVLAHECKDFKLQVSTFKYIVKNLKMGIEIIIKSPVKFNKPLIEDLTRFLRNYAKFDVEKVSELAGKEST